MEGEEVAADSPAQAPEGELNSEAAPPPIHIPLDKELFDLSGTNLVQESFNKLIIMRKKKGDNSLL